MSSWAGGSKTRVCEGSAAGDWNKETYSGARSRRSTVTRGAKRVARKKARARKGQEGREFELPEIPEYSAAQRVALVGHIAACAEEFEKDRRNLGLRETLDERLGHYFAYDTCNAVKLQFDDLQEG